MRFSLVNVQTVFGKRSISVWIDPALAHLVTGKRYNSDLSDIVTTWENKKKRQVKVDKLLGRG